MTRKVSRRAVVRAAAGGGPLAGVASLAGCSFGGSAGEPPDGTVYVGPDGSFVFQPEEVTVGVGETVTWAFNSGSHNVSAYPEHHDDVQLPDGADGFGSVPRDDRYETTSKGETFEHTFETAGTYQYVCVPHAGQGMVGQVVAEE
jgi:plastocyanin